MALCCDLMGFSGRTILWYCKRNFTIIISSNQAIDGMFAHINAKYHTIKHTSSFVEVSMSTHLKWEKALRLLCHPKWHFAKCLNRIRNRLDRRRRVREGNGWEEWEGEKEKNSMRCLSPATRYKSCLYNGAIFSFGFNMPDLWIWWESCKIAYIEMQVSHVIQSKSVKKSMRSNIIESPYVWTFYGHAYWGAIYHWRWNQP